MYFILSKVLWFLTGPTYLLVILAALGAVLLFTRHWRAGRVTRGVCSDRVIVRPGFLPSRMAC